MKTALISLFLLLLLQLGAQTPAAEHVTEALSISGSIAIEGDAATVVGRMNRAWRYSFGQEPAAKLMNKSSKQMTAKAHFYFKSNLITGREDTRGVISYQIVLKAENGKCVYEIHHFIHRGNTTSRRGGVHFGRLMKGALPEGKVRGLGRRNIESIHKDMKVQVEARLSKLLLIFEQHLLLSE